MRVAFVGNQDNNAYRICTWLRDVGVDAELYMMRQESGPRSRPEFVDPTLDPVGKGYPEWIREYDDVGVLSFLRRGVLVGKIEREYDVVVTSGARALLIAPHFRRVPVVHVGLGSEVNDFPMRLFSLRNGLQWPAMAWLSRRGLRHVSRIISGGFWPEMRVFGKLGLLDKVGLWGFAEDVTRNRSRVDQARLGELNDKYASYDSVFIWMTRLNFVVKSSSEYKAAEWFLDAFERLALGDGRKVKAMIGAHGTDVDVFKELVTAKGLDEYVDYVPHVPFWELLTIMSLANGVVVDSPDVETAQALGGGITREAMSVGTPMILGWDKETVDLCYGLGCPALAANGAEECYAAMARVTAMSTDEFGALKADTERWAAEYLHYERRMGRFVEILREAVYCGRFSAG